MSEESYTSPVAETVQATGNFLNRVTNPEFIIVLIMLVLGAIFAYTYLPHIIEIERSVHHTEYTMNHLMMCTLPPAK